MPKSYACRSLKIAPVDRESPVEGAAQRGCTREARRPEARGVNSSETELRSRQVGQYLSNYGSTFAMALAPDLDPCERHAQKRSGSALHNLSR